MNEPSEHQNKLDLLFIDLVKFQNFKTTQVARIYNHSRWNVTFLRPNVATFSIQIALKNGLKQERKLVHNAEIYI